MKARKNRLQEFGVLLADRTGAVQFRRGAFWTPALEAAAVEAAQACDGRSMTRCRIEDDAYVLLCWSDPDAWLVLVHPAECEDALFQVATRNDAYAALNGLIADSMAGARSRSGGDSRSLSFWRRTGALEQIVGESEAILALKEDIRRVAPLDVPVLITGESGTGKELVAHAIHETSRRAERDMVVVNSAALPTELVESELFGYEAGAFTGAGRKGRTGKFEMADRSSLFLDEIGDMPQEVQVKLLRVIQDGIFERLGGDRPIRSSFRLITATNCDIETMVEAKRFRLDLYYRVSGVRLELPPLRERAGDIPLLVDAFLRNYAHKQVRRVSPAVYDMLAGMPWPGNVRQLFHELERALIFSDGGSLEPQAFRGLDSRTQRGEEALPALEPGATMHEAVGDFELSLIRDTLARHNGNKKRAAEELGISRSYLYKRLGAVEEG